MSEQTTIDDTTPDADESSAEQATLDSAWQDPVPNAFRDSPARLASPDAPSHVSASMPDLWIESDLPLKLFTEYGRGIYFTRLPQAAAFPGDSPRHTAFLQEVSEGKIAPPALSVVAADDARLKDGQGRAQIARYDRQEKAICIAHEALENAIGESSADETPAGFPANAKLCLLIIRSFGAYVDHCLTEKYTGVPALQNPPTGRAVAGIFFVAWLRENDKTDYATAWRQGDATALTITYNAILEFMDGE